MAANSGASSSVDQERSIPGRSIGTVAGLSASPTSAVRRGRSAPVPKEATLDALLALTEAAEDLLPMAKFQRAYVDYVLRRFGGNKVHAAAAIGIDRRTIQRWARPRSEVRLASTRGPST